MPTDFGDLRTQKNALNHWATYPGSGSTALFKGPPRTASNVSVVVHQTLIKKNEGLDAQIKVLWKEERQRRNRYEKCYSMLLKEIEELQSKNEGLESENELLWDKKGELEDDITNMRKTRTVRDAQSKAKIEMLEKENQKISQKARTAGDMLWTEIYKLQKQLNQYRRNHIADSAVAQDNYAHTIRLEKACVEYCDEIKELQNDLELEKWDKRETQKIIISSQERLDKQQVSHRKEMVAMHKIINNHEIKRLNALNELEEQDKIIRDLRGQNVKLTTKLNQRREEAANNDAALRTVFNDQERRARKLEEEKENLERKLLHAQKIQEERDE
ncbi:hypothetical protein N431DRAFT_394621 [Stipitochalara longipes BDJ]|nr:hypothetical protein N431DRAFT_394621 [Stipitochalara longipes BDJ]